MCSNTNEKLVDDNSWQCQTREQSRVNVMLSYLLINHVVVDYRWKSVSINFDSHLSFDDFHESSLGSKSFRNFLNSLVDRNSLGKVPDFVFRRTALVFAPNILLNIIIIFV